MLRSEAPLPVLSNEVLNAHYVDTIRDLEFFGQHYLGGRHRFVGGILPDLLQDTSHFSFDLQNRVVTIHDPVPPTLKRDSDNSVHDIDIVHLSTDPAEAALFEKAVANLKLRTRLAEIPVSHIGVEGTHYQGRPRKIRERVKPQFTSAIKKGNDDKMYLSFGRINVSVMPETLEPWTYVAEGLDLAFTGFNPLVYRERYKIRVPSGEKPKDRKSSKLQLLDKMVAGFIVEGDYVGIDYRAMHQEWFEFTQKFVHGLYPIVRLKGGVTWIWWHIPISKWAAHGRGPFRKLMDKTNFNG